MTPTFPTNIKVPELSGLLTQTSTNPPTIITQLNTISETITTSYISPGKYKINATGLFIQDKTHIIMENLSPLSTAYIMYMWSDGNPDYILIWTKSGISFADEVLYKTNFKIQIYNT